MDHRLLLDANGYVHPKIESLLIAEAPAMRTSLVGKSIMQSKLRETIGINVVGVWERGRFEIPTAQTPIKPTTVLLLAGSADQLNEYDEKFGRDKKHPAPVLILGGGRVGRATGGALMERNIDFRLNMIPRPHRRFNGSPRRHAQFNFTYQQFADTVLGNDSVKNLKFYSGCQKKVPLDGRFIAPTTYAAIIRFGTEL